MIDFKGMHFPKDVILFAVFFYLRYPVSYRDLEEIMEERGVDVDHGTLNRWMVKFAPLMAAQAQSRKKPTAQSWRMDETYIKVNFLGSIRISYAHGLTGRIPAAAARTARGVGCLGSTAR